MNKETKIIKRLSICSIICGSIPIPIVVMLIIAINSLHPIDEIENLIEVLVYILPILLPMISLILAIIAERKRNKINYDEKNDNSINELIKASKILSRVSVCIHFILYSIVMYFIIGMVQYYKNR